MTDGSADPVTEQMTIALSIVAGLVLGLLLSGWLRTHRYRYPDERGRLTRAHVWVVAALPLVGWLMAELWSDDPATFLLYGVAAVVLTALTAIDLDVQRLPDRIVLPSYPVFLALLVLLAAQQGRQWELLGRAVLAGLALFGTYLVLALLSPRQSGLGMGDVKLAGLLGMLLGAQSWGHLLVATVFTFGLAGIHALVLAVLRRAKGTDTIPFGPHMVAGAALVLVVLPALG